jgi:murein DD-endopeptidase MepM/ murein hydrolase activator NlpD
MHQRKRFFVFRGPALHYQEVRYFRTKLFLSGLGIATLCVVTLLALNHFAGDFLGIGYDRATLLELENENLKGEIRLLTDKMAEVQNSLERLHVRGNELRLLADLSAVDDDTREAAVGGAVIASADAFLKGEAGTILNEAQTLIEKLSREVRFQQTSYREITRKFEVNKDLFAHMPAIKPMAGYYSINGFGMRIHPVLRVYRMHPGIDIINDVGTKVYCAGDGVVKFAGRTSGGYGIMIQVSHGYGFTTLYAHLSEVLVRVGQTVSRGELIGLSGRSGLVSGPHLHYEVRRNGVKQNPVDYFFDDIDAARYRLQLARVQ